MSIGTPTVAVQNKSDTDATSYTIASTTFTSGNYYLLGTINAKAGTPNTPTISGATSGTWTSVASPTFNTIATPLRRLSVRSYYATSTFSEAVTIDFGGVTQLGCAWVLLEVTGVLQSAPLTQTLTNRTDSSTSESKAMSTFATGGIGIGFVGVSNQRTFTAANGYTMLGSVQQGTTPVQSIQALYKLSQGDPGVTWTTATDSGIVALELAVAITVPTYPTYTEDLLRVEV